MSGPIWSLLIGRRRRLLLAAALGLAAGLLALGCTASCRPGWYEPASIDYARLPADKRDLVNLLDRIGAALNRGRPLTVELAQEQVNRWITARAEIWPDRREIRLGPLRRPLVAFLPDGRARAAALVAWGPCRAVVSSTFRIRRREDRLVVACVAARVGSLPVPARWLAGPLLRSLARLRAGHAELVGTAAVFRNDWLWPNGKRRFRVQTLEIHDRRARLRLEPIRAGR